MLLYVCMNTNSIGVQHNEVVGRDKSCAAPQSVLGRALIDVKEGVKNFLNVGKGQVWHQIPARESQAGLLKSLHAA